MTPRNHDHLAPVPPELPEAMDAAMRYLAPTARSCWEVRRHLVAKGFGAEVAATAQARLVELGILDDSAFAQAAVETALHRRHEAPARVAAALAARGVPEEIAAEALAAAAAARDDEHGLSGALAAGAARLRALRGDPPALRRRLTGYLARRGYDPETCEQACSRLLGDGVGPAEADGCDERVGSSGSRGMSVR